VIGVLGRFIEGRPVDDLFVDRLQQAEFDGTTGVFRLYLRDVPLDIAALHHGLQASEIGRAGVDDLDAGLGFKVVEVGLAQHRRILAARRVDDDRLRLGGLLCERDARRAHA